MDVRASREEAGRCTKSRLICSGQVAEPTSGGCRFPREPAHNGTKDDYANARPFPETFPGRGARESEGDWRSACVKGGELHCGRQADCVSAGEKDEKGCLRLCIPALLAKMHF